MPRPAKRRPSGVNRRMLSQRQKLAMQRNPLLQGPRNPPVQGPRLAIPNSLTSEVRLPTPSRPAPQQIDIFNPAPKPAQAQPSNRIMQMLGIIGQIRGLMTPAGAAAVASRPTALADGTLTAAMQRGDYKPKPKPKPKAPPKKSALSPAAMDFDRAFAQARAAGEKEFTWRGKRYNTRYADE